MNTRDLLAAFNKNEIPHSGVISIWGNFLGKPGDTITHFIEFSIHENEFKISTNHFEIKIKDPKNIFFDKNGIRISEATSVLLIRNGTEHIYDQNNNKNAFEVFTW